jgi:hypothetical protein
MQTDAFDGDLTGEYPVSAGALVEGGHGLAGLGDQNARPLSGHIVLPRSVRGVEHVVVVAADDPTVLVVEVDHIRIATPQPEGSGLLPLADEAADVGQLWRPILIGVVAVADE